MTPLVIFTDLDGTLLDHHSYSWEPARPALAEIRKRGYPLILTSSKTRAELAELQQALDLQHPFVSENGAAIHWREGSDWHCRAFARPHAEVIQVLGQLRDEHGYRFTGFSDCTPEQIHKLTGLSPNQAALAGQREYTEPLLWQDSDERRQQFLTLLQQQRLRGVQGGRFLCVMGEFDKCTAMVHLLAQYRQCGPVTSVALGDSPNDEQMLNAADIAVVVRSARSAQLQVSGAGRVIHTGQAGPAGWQEAMAAILQNTP